MNIVAMDMRGTIREREPAHGASPTVMKPPFWCCHPRRPITSTAIHHTKLQVCDEAVLDLAPVDRVNSTLVSPGQSVTETRFGWVLGPQVASRARPNIAGAQGNAKRVALFEQEAGPSLSHVTLSFTQIAHEIVIESSLLPLFCVFELIDV